MLMIGTNNSGGNTGPEIAEGVGAVVLEMRKNFPNAKILLLAIFPRAACPAIRCATRLPRSTASSPGWTISGTSSTWTSARSSSTTRASSCPDAFRPDNLHPQAKGYDIWGEAVKDKLAELMKPQ